jgi:hypothetical protein
MKALNMGEDCNTPSVTTPIFRVAFEVACARAIGRGASAKRIGDAA